MGLGNRNSNSATPKAAPLHLDLVISWKRGTYLSRANRAFVYFLLERTADYGVD